VNRRVTFDVSGTAGHANGNQQVLGGRTLEG